jgi:hypothetical protein
MLLIFSTTGGQSQGPSPVVGGDGGGFAYFEPKPKHIKKMLKLWGELVESEQPKAPPPEPVVALQPRIIVPPVSDYRKPAYQPKPKAKFEWWKN